MWLVVGCPPPHVQGLYGRRPRRQGGPTPNTQHPTLEHLNTGVFLYFPLFSPKYRFTRSRYSAGTGSLRPSRMTRCWRAFRSPKPLPPRPSEESRPPFWVFTSRVKAFLSG